MGGFYGKGCKKTKITVHENSAWPLLELKKGFFFYRSLYFLRSTSVIQNWNTLNVRFIIQNCEHIKLHHRLEFRGLKESGTYKPVVIVCEVRTRSCPCLSFEGFFKFYFFSNLEISPPQMCCIPFVKQFKLYHFKVPFEIFFALFKNRGVLSCIEECTG